MLKTLDNNNRSRFLEDVYSSLKCRLNINNLVLVQMGENKIRATTKETYETALRMPGVQNVGLYIAKRRKDFTTLTVEGCMFLSKVDESVVVDLSREQALMWMKGGPVKVGKKEKVLLGRYKRFYIGSAVVDRLGNAYPQIPVWRRIPPETI
ncbi:MAG: hypothetical protein QXR26_02805 [Candidatus Caldarchaeum sp.]